MSATSTHIRIHHARSALRRGMRAAKEAVARTQRQGVSAAEAWHHGGAVFAEAMEKHEKSNVPENGLCDRILGLSAEIGELSAMNVIVATLSWMQSIQPSSLDEIPIEHLGSFARGFNRVIDSN